jgi:predicted nuclease with TOPRIM domain
MAVPEHSPIGTDLREDMAEQIATNPAYREAHFDMVNGLQAEVERLTFQLDEHKDEVHRLRRQSRDRHDMLRDREAEVERLREERDHWKRIAERLRADA